MRHALDTGSFESRWDFEKQREQKSIFWTVIDAYLDIQQRSPLSAVNLDPLAVPTKLTFNLVEYLADCELAVNRVLESSALRTQFEALIRGEKIPPETERVITSRCARIFAERHLQPYFYFKKAKKGRADRRPSVAAAQQGAA